VNVAINLESGFTAIALGFVFDTHRCIPEHRIMAKTTITQVTDDIDGTKNAEPVTFSLGNDEYTIDLGSRNRAKLQAALKPYISAATKVSKRSGRNGTSPRGRGPRSSNRSSSSNGTDLGAVRSWASENGYEVSTRGRISKAVMDAYLAAL
jgi:hypothetical protein